MYEFKASRGRPTAEDAAGGGGGEEGPPTSPEESAGGGSGAEGGERARVKQKQLVAGELA